MLIDLEQIRANTSLAATVCIAGAGAAGITLARRLHGRGVRVCLLESGGLDFEADTQALYEGDNVGMPYYDLEAARLRFFGGTTNIWGGRCTPLEPLDFQARSWVPHSGWPISADDLVRYYREVHDELGLGAFGYDDSVWEELGAAAPALTGELLKTRFWRFDTLAERFSAPRCRDLVDADDLTVVLHANVVHVQANADANAVSHLRVRSLTGSELDVRAAYFVLACGGIENARLLLAANDVAHGGIGNCYDQVGRCFMEHQHGRAGLVRTDRPYELWAQFRRRRLDSGLPVAPALLAADTAQRSAGILNSAVTLKLQRRPELGLLVNDRIYRRLKHDLAPDKEHRRMWRAYRNVRGYLQRRLKPPLDRLRTRTGHRQLYLMVRAEQAPNPDSRVKLTARRDALGMPRIELDWRLSDIDKRTVAVLAECLDRELERLGLGRVEPAPWLDDPSPAWPLDPTVSKHPIGGYHHMGTTRMSASPRRGVVDAQCRVHGCDNLYIAGSSVFTTAGWANPTLTILALAHRLGDHLAARLNKEGHAS